MLALDLSQRSSVRVASAWGEEGALRAGHTAALGSGLSGIKFEDASFGVFRVDDDACRAEPC